MAGDPATLLGGPAGWAGPGAATASVDTVIRCVELRHGEYVDPSGPSTVSSARSRRTADPLFVGWTAVLPSLATNYEPDSSDDCVAGRASCVQKTIREMQRRFDPLANQCDHDALFSLVRNGASRKRWAEASDWRVTSSEVRVVARTRSAIRGGTDGKRTHVAANILPC
jgi:hypothetical protein